MRVDKALENCWMLARRILVSGDPQNEKAQNIVRICEEAGVQQHGLFRHTSPALTWTPTPPTVPGWYWWRDETRVLLVNFFPDYNQHPCWQHGQRATSSFRGLDQGGEWAGPLAEPQGQEGG
jgi:hypothetical protein